MTERHEADGVPVLTIVGNDGVRWACRVCNQTVFQRGGGFLHFDKSLNPFPRPTPNFDCAGRDRPHGPHQLAGPGGNKPGAQCAGAGCPECGVAVVVAETWGEWACADPDCVNAHGDAPGGGHPLGEAVKP